MDDHKFPYLLAMLVLSAFVFLVFVAALDHGYTQKLRSASLVAAYSEAMACRAEYSAHHPNWADNCGPIPSLAGLSPAAAIPLPEGES